MISTAATAKGVLLRQGVFPTEWPEVTIVKQNLWGWKTNMGKEVQHEINNWQMHYSKACAEFGNAANLHKNPLAIARTLEIAWEAGEVSNSLTKLVKAILQFSKYANGNVVERGEAPGVVVG